MITSSTWLIFYAEQNKYNNKNEYTLKNGTADDKSLNIFIYMNERHFKWNSTWRDWLKSKCTKPIILAFIRCFNDILSWRRNNRKLKWEQQKLRDTDNNHRTIYSIHICVLYLIDGWGTHKILYFVCFGSSILYCAYNVYCCI